MRKKRCDLCTKKHITKVKEHGRRTFQSAICALASDSLYPAPGEGFFFRAFTISFKLSFGPCKLRLLFNRMRNDQCAAQRAYASASNSVEPTHEGLAQSCL